MEWAREILEKIEASRMDRINMDPPGLEAGSCRVLAGTVSS